MPVDSTKSTSKSKEKIKCTKSVRKPRQPVVSNTMSSSNKNSSQPTSSKVSNHQKPLPPATNGSIDSMKASENKKRSKPEDSCLNNYSAAIKISNLSKTTSDQDLEDLVKPFGDIQKLFLAKTKKTEVCRGYANVHFKTKAEAARAIIILNGYKHDDLILNVDWLMPMPKQLLDDSLAITVSNLSKNITKQDMRNLFAPFGNIQKLYLAETEKVDVGCGVVHFKTNAEAARAIRMLDGQKYCHHILNVNWYEPLQMQCEEDTAITEAAIRISNLPENITDQDLKELVEPFGNFKHCFLSKEKNNRNVCRGFAYVHFESLAEAERAVTMLNNLENNHLILQVNLIDQCKHNTIKISNLSENTTDQDLADLVKPFEDIQKLCLTKEKKKKLYQGLAYVQFKTKTEAARAISVLNNYKHNGMVLKADWFEDLQKQQHQNNATISISNLSKNTTDQDLTNLIKLLKMNINRCCLGKHKNTNICRGFANVNFKSKADATKAIKFLNGFKFNNSILSADWMKFPQTECQENSRAIRICNLSISTSEQELENLVKPFGNIQKVRLSKENFCRGFARVHFQTKAEASIAKNALNGSKYANSILSVKWVKPPRKHLRKNKKSFTLAAVGVSKLAGINLFSSTASNQGKKQSQKKSSKRRGDAASIKISNLPESITTQQLEAIVKRFRNITKIFIAYEKNSKICKGFAYVHFRDKEEAQKAISELNGFKLDYLILSVDWSESPQKQNLDDTQVLRTSNFLADRKQLLEDFVKKFVGIKKRYLTKERSSLKMGKPFAFTNFINLVDYQVR